MHDMQASPVAKRRSSRRCVTRFHLSEADAQSDAQLEALLALGALDDYNPWPKSKGVQARTRKAGRCGSNGKVLDRGLAQALTGGVHQEQ